MNELLAAARGDAPCDLVIRNGRVANVLSLEYEEADVAIHKGVIVGVGKGYAAKETADASGCVLIPGMIDGHLHIESTMLTPAAFADAVLPRGTTTVLPDPHEIANTCGMAGIEFMWRDSLRSPLDIFFAAPSCVPASSFETPREEIDASELVDAFNSCCCTHLGEMMNYPGVIGGDPAVWAKITSASKQVKTAHLPGVTGRALCAYLLSGCNGDHESNFADEALEKLRRGVWVMLREGATEHNLEETARIILEDEARHSRCMAVSDDLTADYILRLGHMDHKVRLMIGLGIRPLVALAMVTINPAQYFRMWDRGAIAPGMIADIAMVDSPENCRALRVWKRGRLVAENGDILRSAGPPPAAELPVSDTRRITVNEDSFRIPAREGYDIRVVSVIPGSVLTRHLAITPTVRGGLLTADPKRDLAKMVVIEKNRGTGRVAVGFASGFGLKRGAFASSVAHDAHNFVAVGMDDASLASALRFLAKNGGGLAAAADGEVIASFALPIGGLMSDREPAYVADAVSSMEKTVAELGVSIGHPFMALSFLSLSVIPELKLTDQGYVDLSRGGAQDLFALHNDITGGSQS